jgi:hypothetical protein
MASNQEFRHVPITDGPSKFDLMVALFDRKPRSRVLTFETGGGQKVEVTIVSVQIEDGSGESWNIQVSIQSANCRMSSGIKWIPICRMYFRTDKRKGHLNVPNELQFAY